MGMPGKPSCCQCTATRARHVCGDPGNVFPPCLWWQSVPTRKRLRWQRHLCRRKHFRCQKSRSNGDQRNPRHVSLNITKCDVDIRKDLSDNVVMHCHDPRDRRTRDEEVDCVGTTNDVLRWCLHQRIPWQSSLASPDGVTGGTSLRIESRALCMTRSEEDSGPGHSSSGLAYQTVFSIQSVSQFEENVSTSLV